MTMRQEIRKRFAGPPRLWEAAVAVEDVRPYLIEAGGRLRPLVTSREHRIDFFSQKSEFAKHVVRDRQQLTLARAARPTATIDPNLVLYSPDGQLPPVKTGGLQTATRDQTVD